MLRAVHDPGIRGEMGFSILRRVGAWVSPQYRFQWPQMDWWHDEPFNQYLRRFDEAKGMNAGRRWTLYQLTRLVAAVPGDTAECGAFAGAGSYLICRSVEEHPAGPRTHFVFDSFEGLSTPSAADGSHWTEGDLACALETVQTNLRSCGNISWHKGWIPDRFKDVEQRRFSFVHIDVDIYGPTRDSLQFFYPRMNQGGIIVCDDYGFTTCPGATKAVDEFLADKPEKMLPLPCGGGFLIKGCATAVLPLR